ncbi:hypothetical protein [Tenacibaculum sp.]|uniref:hypothetical protein n=1 Tax=Tenacibaculum sp. TaxID=1906242 RepID=UPI003D0CD24C
MKYFLDTEFHEFQKKPLFGKPIDTIELISIGIVSEELESNDLSNHTQDNITSLYYSNKIAKGSYCRQYYAICKEFDLKAAWNNEWLRENVVKNLFWQNEHPLYIEGKQYDFTYRNFKNLINKYGKTKKQIAEEILDFVNTNGILVHKSNGSKEQNNIVFQDIIEKYGKPEFYAYYADYDWVLFCWLFGRMVDLPNGFPMYCKDLKQMLDEHFILERDVYEYIESCISCNQKVSLEDLKDIFHEDISKHPNYPKQTNGHNALSDARWNRELYKFLKNL